MGESKDNKKTAFLAIGVILAFLALVLVIFLIGKAKHKDPSSGLDESVEREILVQYLVKVDPKLKMDVTPEAMAHRVAFDRPGSITIRVTNLLKEPQAGRIYFEVHPEKAKNSVEFLDGDNFVATIAAKEKMEFKVPYELHQDKMHTIDGTIDLVIRAEPPSEQTEESTDDPAVEPVTE